MILTQFPKSSDMALKKKTPNGSYVKIKLKETTDKDPLFDNGSLSYSYMPLIGENPEVKPLDKVWVEGFVFDNHEDYIVLTDAKETTNELQTNEPIVVIDTNAITRFELIKNSAHEKLETLLNEVGTQTPVTVDFKPGVLHIPSQRTGYDHAYEYTVGPEARRMVSQSTPQSISGHIIRTPENCTTNDFIIHAKAQYSIDPMKGTYRPTFISLDAVKAITTYKVDKKLSMD